MILGHESLSNKCSLTWKEQLHVWGGLQREQYVCKKFTFISPSTPNSGMCHYHSPHSFFGWLGMFISLTKGSIAHYSILTLESLIPRCIIAIQLDPLQCSFSYISWWFSPCKGMYMPFILWWKVMPANLCFCSLCSSALELSQCFCKRCFFIYWWGPFCAGETSAFKRGKPHKCTILVYTRALEGCHGVLTQLSSSAWHLEIRCVMLGYATTLLTTNQIICSCFNNSDELTAIGHHRRHYRMTSEQLKWRRQHRQRILHWSLVWFWYWVDLGSRNMSQFDGTSCNFLGSRNIDWLMSSSWIFPENAFAARLSQQPRRVTWESCIWSSR